MTDSFVVHSNPLAMEASGSASAAEGEIRAASPSTASALSRFTTQQSSPTAGGESAVAPPFSSTDELPPVLTMLQLLDEQARQMAYQMRAASKEVAAMVNDMEALLNLWGTRLQLPSAVGRPDSSAGSSSLLGSARFAGDDPDNGQEVVAAVAATRLAADPNALRQAHFSARLAQQQGNGRAQLASPPQAPPATAPLHSSPAAAALQSSPAPSPRDWAVAAASSLLQRPSPKGALASPSLLSSPSQPSSPQQPQDRLQPAYLASLPMVRGLDIATSPSSGGGDSARVHQPAPPPPPPPPGSDSGGS